MLERFAAASAFCYMCGGDTTLLLDEQKSCNASLACLLSSCHARRLPGTKHIL